MRSRPICPSRARSDSVPRIHHPPSGLEDTLEGLEGLDDLDSDELQDHRRILGAEFATLSARVSS